MKDDTLEKLAPKPKKKKLKKGNSSKNKGKTGEYFFAKILSSISGMNFLRIFTSGASVGKSNRGRLSNLTVGQAEQQLGDIASPETLKRMLIWESKNYVDLDLHNLISKNGGSKMFYQWLDEMMFDVESAISELKSQRPPFGFLCVKLTRKGSWIAVNYQGYENTFGSKPIIQPPYVVLDYEPREFLQDNNWGNKWILEDFERFITFNQDVLFEQLNEEEIKAIILATVEKNMEIVKKKSTKEILRGK